MFGRRMRQQAGRLVALFVAAMALPANARDCYPPSWRVVNDAAMGASFELSADTHRSHYIAYHLGVPTVSVEEGFRSGNEVGGRCSTFSAAMFDFGSRRITDAEGLFDALQKDAAEGGRLVSSRSRRINGYPAREYRHTFTTEFFGTPATHRTLLVARDNRLYSFTSVWGDAGEPPADSERIFRSIRLTAGQPNPHLATFALLEETITKYWMFPSDSGSQGHMSPALRKIADPKRKQEGAIVKAYGYPRQTTFVGMNGQYKVVRIRHDDATVDWFVQDDGKQINALTWRKR